MKISFIEDRGTMLMVVVAAIAAAMLFAAIPITDVHASKTGNLRNCTSRPCGGGPGEEVQITTQGTPAHDQALKCASVHEAQVNNRHTEAICG